MNSVISSDPIEENFKEKVSAKIRLMAEGVERYRVFTPFRFEDGDHLVIVLRRERTGWVLSDEAHTYMHLTYDIDEKDLHEGTRQQIISNALSAFGVADRDGELVIKVPDEQYGNSLYSFVQALLKVSDVSFLSRERAKTAFLHDIREMFITTIPEIRRTFNWHDTQRDPTGKYLVDWRINGMPRPLFVHTPTNDQQTRDSTISLLRFEKWGIPFRSLAIFENQELIGRKVLARFTDVCEKQFSSLTDNRDRAERFLSEAISLSDGAD